MLLAEVERRGLVEDDCKFDYDWVYRRFFSTAKQASFMDLSGVVEALQERLDSYGLRFEIYLDKLGYTECVFFELAGGMEEWSRSPATNVLLFDPTHGTNRYGLKLCCFVAVSHTGRSTILACLWIQKENPWSFEWGFRCFSKTFRTPPHVVFTDHDTSIELVLVKLAQEGEIWWGIIHLLCVFHISKNLFTHLNRLFGANKLGWKEVMDMFWKIAKTCDIMLTTSAWKGECLTLTELVLKHVPKDHPDLAKEMNWLNNLLDYGHKWALRFVWQHITFGIHSTQRSESVQAKVKSRLVANSTGVQLLTHMEKINEREGSLNVLKEKQEELRQAKQNSKPHQQVVAKLLPYLTPYGARLLLGQAEQALAYTSKPYTEEDYFEAVDMETDEYLITDDRQDLLKRIDRQGTELFIVVREQLEPPEKLQYDEHGCITSFASNADFGCGTVEDKPRRRLTSYVGCSCLFSVTFGKIPCRHIIYVCSQQQVLYKLSNIDVKWIRSDVDASSARLRTLYSTPAPVAVASTAGRQASSSTMGSTDRRALLTREFNSVVDVACRADLDTFAAALSALSQAFAQLTATTHMPVHGHGLRSSTPAAPAVRPKEAYADYADLQTTLGMEHWLKTLPAALDFSTVLGTRVAVKWDKAGKEGWFVGSCVRVVNPVVDNLSTDKDGAGCFCASGKESHCNVQVKYDLADGDTLPPLQNHIFGLHNMVDCGAQADTFAWGIVEDRGLSNHAGQTVRNPLCEQGRRGPKQTKRRCAHAGPTAKRPAAATKQPGDGKRKK